MRSSEAALHGLRPRSIRALIEDAAYRSRSEDAESLPVISALLNAGHSIRGRVVGIADGGRDDGAILLQAVDDSGGDDALYVDVSQIVAVRVHNAGSQALERRRRELGLPPPTRLDLLRRLENGAGAPLEALAYEVDWNAVPDGDEARSALAVLIERTSSVLRDIAGEPAGAGALADVTCVRFVPADGSSATLDGALLTIHQDLTRGGAGIPRYERLRDLVASTL